MDKVRGSATIVAWLLLLPTTAALLSCPSGRAPHRAAQVYSQGSNDWHAAEETGRQQAQAAVGRRHVLHSGAAVLSSMVALGPLPASALFGGGGDTQPFGPLPKNAEFEPVALQFSVKCLDYSVGKGAQPEYGQALRLNWVGYVRTSANAELVKFDSTMDRGEVFLYKHGNGRILQGLDQGVHTMKVGGKRRISFPNRLGYKEAGFYGPIPPSPFSRRNLEGLIAKLDETGEVVFDVHLIEAFDDDADPGYYKDSSFSPQVMQLVEKRLELMESMAK
eukprot:CAMPEP_0172603654 /NCGR_PEP_ID=MMETSP1068-20121228/23906_1 /TAXON_ID=35684 /ORGANISM="Pseudopedinella elastica, Strain CCMP716" /LENGTH=276 /DNA_ID=CAMNT_0013405469 /DNA_START=38 /DNA_END=868 /DNA_ORIENTATION=-